MTTWNIIAEGKSAGFIVGTHFEVNANGTVTFHDDQGTVAVLSRWDYFVRADPAPTAVPAHLVPQPAPEPAPAPA